MALEDPPKHIGSLGRKLKEARESQGHKIKADIYIPEFLRKN